MSASRKGITVALLPSIALLALYYSLAIHMYHSLGGWPTAIGEVGFPRALVVHATVTVYFCNAVVISLFLVAVPILVGFFEERWRQVAIYLALYAGAFVFSFAITQVAAPAQFLNWWRD